MYLICDDCQPIELKLSDAFRLELFLNVSPYARKWLLLGNRLYDWAVGREVPNTFKVNESQYIWVLKRLNQQPILNT